MARDRKSTQIAIAEMALHSTKLLRKRIGVLAVIAITVAISLALVNTSYAKDFGVVGHSYEIIEQDIIEYIKEKLSSKDLEALNKEMQDKVKERLERPEPVVGISDAKESREYYYDPTFILKQDIRDYKGQLIHAKGKEINPLSKVPLKIALIFINGDNEKQVEYALNEYKALQEKAKIILTNGSPVKLQKEHKDIWIYFDLFGALTKTLGITAVPAVVKQNELRLKINEVALK